jgi:hypothetical protein
MGTAHLLKEEINQSTDALHDFAKWKLIVVSALAAAALGLTPTGPYPSLLVLIPYACAYVDLNSYQHLIRITVIAQFLRKHDGDKDLQLYELQCDHLRAKRYGVFDLMIYAQIWSSVAMSILAIGGAIFLFAHKGEWVRCLFSLYIGEFGLVLVMGLWAYYKRKDKVARTEPLPDEALLAKFNGA